VQFIEFCNGALMNIKNAIKLYETA